VFVMRLLSYNFIIDSRHSLSEVTGNQYNWIQQSMKFGSGLTEMNESMGNINLY